ncbi:MAG: Gfo/Idh/MocA family oxidoreductase [Alkalispirochaeta sp.]
MTENPVTKLLGRRLRIAMIGGGPGSFIGGIHRIAARMDDCYELTTGIFSSRPERSAEIARDFGIAPDRIYNDVDHLLERESARDDGIDVVAIMTPNDSHYSYAMAAVNHGFNVICDKPLTNTLEEARQLHAAVVEAKVVFCLTHNYTGYPMVRQARALVESGALGEIRLVQVEYVQGGKAEPIEMDSDAPRSWKFEPARRGPSAVMGDIGTHAHNLVRYITTLEISAVAAELGAIVPGREFDDYAGAFLRLENGGRGVFWVTQAAAGMDNSLKIRVSGDKGTVEWQQEIPQQLDYRPLHEPAQRIVPNGPGVLPLSKRVSRIVKGHPEGFPEAFANIYRDAAEAIAARIAGTTPDPLAMTFPTAADGLKGVEFVAAAIESNTNGGRWIDL